MYSLGVVTSTFMIGSSRIGPAARLASFQPIEAAILNAISDESTSWYEPSNAVDLEVQHREAGEHAALRRLPDALLHGLGILLGNRAADDLPLEDETGAGRLRLDAQPDVAVLAFAAGLADELALPFRPSW